MSRRAKKWLSWGLMIASAVIFIAGDVLAAKLETEKKGERVTTTAWVRYGIKKSFGAVAVLGLGLILWHFVLQIWFPNLPL